MTIYINNFKNYREIHTDPVKVTEGIIDGAALIAEIKRLLKKIVISVKIEYRIIRKKRVVKFEDDLLLFLLEECDTKSKATWLQVE